MRETSKHIARRRRAACAVAPLQLPSPLLLLLPLRCARLHLLLPLRRAPLQLQLPLLLLSPVRRAPLLLPSPVRRRCAVVVAPCAVAITIASPVRRRRCFVGSAADGPAAKLDIE